MQTRARGDFHQSKAGSLRGRGVEPRLPCTQLTSYTVESSQITTAALVYLCAWVLQSRIDLSQGCSAQMLRLRKMNQSDFEVSWLGCVG
jgi:hypothetical protein